MNYYSKDFNTLLKETGENGFVETVSHPVAHVSGLPSAKTHELIVFETGETGWVLSLMSDVVEVLVLSGTPVAVGTQVVRSGQTLEVPVGYEMLGHSVNSLGQSIYADERFTVREYRNIDNPAPGISARSKVTLPLETGVTVVDMTVPLGKGQRELIIGDRKTGKSEFLLQTFLTQARKGVVCIYACIGKKRTDVRRIEEFIRRNGVSQNCVMVASSSSDPLGMIYLTPYTAMTLAEYFRDQGNEVLIILDDLTTHARFYREISLICKRFPGRSSYPGDIFYTHSRLLERAGNFKTEKGDVAITCFPVAETVEGDISGYIQTNIMSITDGHIFFDREVFEQGRRPAVNYFLSVTRVGRQTQTKLRWSINRELFSFLTLYEKTQDFVHFGAEINEGIKSTLAMGDKILSLFNQPMEQVLGLDLQIMIFTLIWSNILTTEESNEVRFVIDRVVTRYITDPEFAKLVNETVSSAEDLNALLGKVLPNASTWKKFVSKQG